MRTNQRWIYLASGEAPDGYDVRRSRGEWFVVRSAVSRPDAIGPLGEGEILRSFRCATHAVIDGCELLPPTGGFFRMSPAPLPDRRDWVCVAASELPASKTLYSADDAAPCRGCCTVFDAYPDVTPADLASAPRDVMVAVDGFAHTGVLRKAWNAHPRGSFVAWSGLLQSGFLIVDVA